MNKKRSVIIPRRYRASVPIRCAVKKQIPFRLRRIVRKNRAKNYVVISRSVIFSSLANSRFDAGILRNLRD